MAKTGYGNFDYTCQGPWRGAVHNFSIVGNHSGNALSATNAKTFLEGASSPYALSFAPFQAPGSISVVAARYYNGVDSAPIYEATYTDESPAPAPLTPTAAAYPDGGEYCMPLETCVILEAVVGQSKTNKPVYCRKYLRGGPINSVGHEDPDGDPIWEFGSGATAAANAMGNGSWFNGLVYISPKGAQAASNGWTAVPQLGNHQVPRGRKLRVKDGSSFISLANAEKLLLALGG